MTDDDSAAPAARRPSAGCSTRIERVGNKVPHPAIIFLT